MSTDFLDSDSILAAFDLLDSIRQRKAVERRNKQVERRKVKINRLERRYGEIGDQFRPRLVGFKPASPEVMADRLGSHREKRVKINPKSFQLRPKAQVTINDQQRQVLDRLFNSIGRK